MSSGKMTIIASVRPPLLFSLSAWACKPRSKACRTSSRSHHMCVTMAAEWRRSTENSGSAQGHAAMTSRGTLNTTAATSLSSSFCPSAFRALRLQNARERSTCDMDIDMVSPLMIGRRILGTGQPIRRHKTISATRAGSPGNTGFAVRKNRRVAEMKTR